MTNPGLRHGNSWYVFYNRLVVRGFVFSGIEGGTKRRGERSANFARRALAKKKGGIFAAAACQLAAFSSKFFQTGRSAFLLRSISAR